MVLSAIIFFCKTDSFQLQSDGDLNYVPTPLDQLGLRVETPPPDLGWDMSKEERAKVAQRQEKASNAKANTSGNKVEIRRKMFAQRRDSSIGTAMIMEPLADAEMRRRFRNYEI